MRTVGTLDRIPQNQTFRWNVADLGTVLCYRRGLPLEDNTALNT
jgi:hypothetical protein